MKSVKFVLLHDQKLKNPIISNQMKCEILEWSASFEWHWENLLWWHSKIISTELWTKGTEIVSDHSHSIYLFFVTKYQNHELMIGEPETEAWTKYI